MERKLEGKGIDGEGMPRIIASAADRINVMNRAKLRYAQEIFKLKFMTIPKN